MKNLNALMITLSVISIGLSSNLLAQIDIQWQKTIGGTLQDRAKDLIGTSDGGFILCGTTISNDGDFPGGAGSFDVCIVKTDANGNIIWKKTYGGSGSEFAESIWQTTDGGYVVAGATNSSDGDVSEYNGNFPSSDFWVLKLDPSGNLEWEKTYGGTKSDYCSAVQQTFDGGYILAGHTSSYDGDVTESYNNPISPTNTDTWIVKLNSVGEIQWEKVTGGTAYDTYNDVTQVSDGGYVAVGYTKSNDGDVVGLHEASGSNPYDFWVVKYDVNGNVIWKRALGGYNDDYAFDVYETSSNRCLVLGYTHSMDGDLDGINLGDNAGWIVQFDASGNIEWQQAYTNSEFSGLTCTNTLRKISPTVDAGYILCGMTYLPDIYSTSEVDIWVVKIDGIGNLQWEKSFGGSHPDLSWSIVEASEKEYVIVGETDSDDGDVSGNHSDDSDIWLFKITDCIPDVVAPADIVVSTDAGICGAVVNYPSPTVQWSCSSVSVIQTSGPELGGTFPVGTTVVGFLATDASGYTASCNFTVTVITDISADAGADETVIIDSGPGPDPYPCVTLDASATGGSGPYTYSWLPTTGLSNSNIADPEACPTVTTTYTLTVTDANGCTDTDELTVTVIDIDNAGSLPTVGNNSNKVYVCHLATCTTVEANIQANCNSPHSLCAHISHGDVLGPCGCKTDGNSASQSANHTTQIMAVPNPFTSSTHILFTLRYDSDVQLSVMDITGKEVAQLFNGSVKEGVVNRAIFNGADLASGIYFYHLTTDRDERISEKLVLAR